MRIAVNTRLLIKNKLEGIGWFAYEVLKRLSRNHPQYEFIFIFDRPFSKDFIFDKNVHPVVAGPQARHPFLFLLWFELTVPRILKKYKADVFLSPDGYLSLKTKTPSIAVMHDLNFEHYPKDLPFLVRHYYKQMFPRFAKKATKIVTVSEYSATDIAKQYAIDKSKISVAYNGANELFAPGTEAEKKDTRNQLTEGKPYLLFVGALHPRKNINNMLKAFDRYKSANPEDSVKLVLAGEKMWWNKTMESTFNSMQHKPDIIFSGRMNSEELRKAYGAAEALLYISYFEGFGIPIIEAYRCHTPVITSNVTSMPEVAGDGALYVDPFDIETIVMAIHKLRNDNELRKQLVNAGIKKSKQFSWDYTAQNIWKTIQEVTSKL
ncbi:MAG: glycosyltransferase family 4 protein [Bacteroidales bacterium]|nr:glycosyltransferase family 4 protein [Bacteroidales bacterium]MCF8327751.1 glycosyltransferase family 4 protein [Bacteroidales bacterium]